MLNMASRREYDSGRTPRDWLVGSRKSGITTPIRKFSCSRMRTARARPAASAALAVTPPSAQAATLSGCPSIRADSSSTRARSHPQLPRAEAMTTPAVTAAALEPNPLPSGMSLEISSSSGVRAPQRTAACQLRLSSPQEMSPASRPLARIRRVSDSRKRHFRYIPAARARPSKPGPRFALEAGTRTLRQSRIDPHLLALAAGLIHGLHQLQRAEALFAGYHRIAVLANRRAKIQKLPLKRRQRNGHGIACAGCSAGRHRSAGVALHIPRRKLVAGNDRRASGAVNFDPLRITGTDRGGGLHHSDGAGAVAQQRAHHVFRFDFMRRAQLPFPVHMTHRTAQPQQNIDLVNGLIDQRAAALHFPGSLDGPRIILVRAPPLHVCVGLENFSEPPGVDGRFEKQAGVIETVLAHHAQPDIGRPRQLDHPPRVGQLDRHRLLHLNVLAGGGAALHRGQPEVREGADVDEIDVCAGADLLPSFGEADAVALGEGPPEGGVFVAADGDLVADVAVSLHVLVCNGAGADDSYSHIRIYSVMFSR